MIESASLATVLLPEGAPMRSYERADGTLGAVKDHSYLEFLIEALIAQSAVALAVYPSSSFYDDLDHLPASLRSCIRKVDKYSEAYEKACAVLSPIIAELGIVIRGEGGVFEIPEGVDTELAHALVYVLLGLRKFLIGLSITIRSLWTPPRWSPHCDCYATTSHVPTHAQTLHPLRASSRLTSR